MTPPPQGTKFDGRIPSVSLYEWSPRIWRLAGVGLNRAYRHYAPHALVVSAPRPTHPLHIQRVHGPTIKNTPCTDAPPTFKDRVVNRALATSYQSWQECLEKRAHRHCALSSPLLTTSAKHSQDPLRLTAVVARMLHHQLPPSNTGQLGDTTRDAQVFVQGPS